MRSASHVPHAPWIGDRRFAARRLIVQARCRLQAIDRFSQSREAIQFPSPLRVAFGLDCVE